MSNIEAGIVLSMGVGINLSLQNFGYTPKLGKCVKYHPPLGLEEYWAVETGDFKIKIGSYLQWGPRSAISCSLAGFYGNISLHMPADGGIWL